jgi:hypothetical protein
MRDMKCPHGIFRWAYLVMERTGNVTTRQLRRFPLTSGIRHLRRAELVVGDIPGLDADHAAPGGVAEIGHGGCFLGPGVPHHARCRAVLLDDYAAAPPAIFYDALPRCIEIDAVGLRRDCDEIRSLLLAPGASVLSM